jgi:hypothetical protein
MVALNVLSLVHLGEKFSLHLRTITKFDFKPSATKPDKEAIQLSKPDKFNPSKVFFIL